MHFSFNFSWYSIHFDIVHKEQGVGFFLLNGQNSLSVTKVIWTRIPEILKKTKNLKTINHKTKTLLSNLWDVF